MVIHSKEKENEERGEYKLPRKKVVGGPISSLGISHQRCCGVKTNKKTFCWDIFEDIIWRKSFWKEILEINRWVKTNKPLIFVLCLLSICVLFPFTFFIYIIWLLLRGWTMKSKLFYVFLAPSQTKPSWIKLLLWRRFVEWIKVLNVLGSLCCNNHCNYHY